jgi:hypothetical protein
LKIQNNVNQINELNFNIQVINQNNNLIFLA